MRKRHYVTVSQAIKLRNIDICMHKEIDTVIDIIRKKYKVVIYNTTPPHVEEKTKKIVYGFSVKVCNTKWGWNARKYLGQTKWRTNIYQAKREAINIAIKWILSHKSQKSKKSKIVAINASSKQKQD